MYVAGGVILTDRKGKEINNPIINDVQKALTNLLISNPNEPIKPDGNYVSLLNLNELELQIYQQTVVLQDWATPYDGPGGPGEILRVRYKEGSLFDKIEDAVTFLGDEEREKLLKLLKSLPKPE